MEERLFENDKTELKSVLNEKLEKEVVAFLNSKTGGDIYIGITDDGTALGIENVDKILLAVSDRIKNNILPNCLGLFEVDFVEQLGSGMNRILRSYSRSVFNLSENFLEVVFPFEEEYLKSINQSYTGTTPQVTPQVKTLIMAVQGEMTRIEIQKQLGLKDEKHFRENYQQKSLKLGILEMTIPEKPNSRLQKYRLTQNGLEMKKQLSDMKKKN